jgi:dTDP-4-dehydrorhamnose reductase
LATILVFGSGGQLGTELLRGAWPAGLTVVGLPRAACDIADPAAVAAALDAHRPDLIVNAAAYTAVDHAETETAAAYRTNRDGPETLGAAAFRHGITVIHVSTDYVFDGCKPSAYHESDPTAPLGIYGASKLDGEIALTAATPDHLILRTSWVFGAQGGNFVKTMLRLAGERPILGVVDDQRGCPTPADSFGQAIAAISEAILKGHPGRGIYHLCGDRRTTWHGFATAIFEILAARGNKIPAVEAIPTSAYPTPARRPANSVLDCRRIGTDFGIAPLDWRAGLARLLDNLLPAASG